MELDPDKNYSREELAEIVNRSPLPSFDPSLIKMMFQGWNPFPDKAYAEKVGWSVNADGTITTPGLGRVPSRELCEVKELEKLYEVSDLKHLYDL